jgi:hypothetical protein
MGQFDKALDEDYQNQPVMRAIPPERSMPQTQQSVVTPQTTTTFVNVGMAGVTSLPCLHLLDIITGQTLTVLSVDFVEFRSRDPNRYQIAP